MSLPDTIYRPRFHHSAFTGDGRVFCNCLSATFKKYRYSGAAWKFGESVWIYRLIENWEKTPEQIGGGQ